MTEEQFDMEKKEAMKWLSDYSYDKERQNEKRSELPRTRQKD